MQRAFAKWSDAAMLACDRTAQRFFAVATERRDDPSAPRRDAIVPPPPDDASCREPEPSGPQMGSFAQVDDVEADLTRDSRYEGTELDERSVITPLIAASFHRRRRAAP